MLALSSLHTSSPPGARPRWMWAMRQHVSLEELQAFRFVPTGSVQALTTFQGRLG